MVEWGQFMIRHKFRAVHTGASRQRTKGMNKLETAYAARLEMLKASGEILDYAFESVKLRLADKTFYSPDFVVYQADGTIEIHETKGHWEDDARVKIKVAAAMFPFRFFGVTRKKSEWIFEDFTQ